MPAEPNDQYWISPAIDQLGNITASNVRAAFDRSLDRPAFQWRDREFLDRLIGTGKSDPFVVFQVGPNQYALAHDMAGRVRRWSADLSITRRFSAKGTGPALKLQTQNAPQWFIDSKVDWSTAAQTAAESDPRIHRRQLVDYREMFVTVSMELDERIAYRVVNRTPAAGIPVRALTIPFRKRRLDLTLPQTIVGIKPDGSLELLENGQIDRDDRVEIAQDTAGAAFWFSRLRRAISARWKQVNDQGAQLGMLLTSISSLYEPDQAAFAVVTSITTTYPAVVIGQTTENADPGSTAIQTSFADPNFGEFF